MHYFKIIFFTFFLMLLSGCGKPPILNKLEKPLQAVSDNISITVQNRKIDFTLYWITPPTTLDLSSFTLTLSEALPNNMTINAFIDMPDMGHGSSPIVIEKISETEYKFTEVSFFMTGLWVLYIEFSENNQAVYKWQKSYTVL